MNTLEKGVVGIPFLDEYIEKAATEYLDKAGFAGQHALGHLIEHCSQFWAHVREPFRVAVGISV